MSGDYLRADVWTLPCPKCGDNTCSRRVRYVDFERAWPEEEALEVECLACGYDMGLFHTMDHEKAGGRVDG